MTESEVVKKPKRNMNQKQLLLISLPFIGIAVGLLAIFDPLGLKDAFKTLVVGFVSFVLGMWYFNQYILPQLYVKMGSNLFHQASEDPNFKPIIQKAKKIVEDLEPFVTKIKKIDVDKIQKDMQPLIEALKKVDPKDVDDLLKELKGLTGTIKKSIEKPKIPEPTQSVV